MSSYALQGASSLVFGPALSLLSLYAGSDPGSDSYLALPADLWVSEFFVPVAASMHQTNVVTAFSILFATLIRVRQVCPVAERNFLRYLVGYEVLTAVICTLSYLPMHQSSRLKKTVMVFYVLATVIMVFIALDWTVLGAEPYASAFEAVTKYCVQQHDWPVPEISLAPPAGVEPRSPEGSSPSWRDLLGDFLIVLSSPISVLVLVVTISMMVVVVFLAFLLVLGLLGVSMKLAGGAIGGVIVDLFARQYAAACHILHVGPMRFGALLVTAGFTCISTELVARTLSALLVQRQKLRAASGASYEDDDCEYPRTLGGGGCYPRLLTAKSVGGFGQITALLMWIPTAQDTLFAVVGTSRIYHK